MKENQDVIMESLAPYESAEVMAPWKMLIVDDEIEVHKMTRLVLGDVEFDGRSISFLSAQSSQEARDIFEDHPDIAIVLLDVVMNTDDAGLELVSYIRQTLNNHRVRIIIRSGQSGQISEQDVITKYEIDDYKSKLELTNEKLYVSVISSLRTFRTLDTMHKRVNQLENDFKQLKRTKTNADPLGKSHEEQEAERTIELESANMQLKKAIEKVKELVREADSANRAKGEFLANMSHEIRTPMNGVLGMTEMLLGTNLDIEQKEYVQIIRSSSKSLLTIINAILDYSKIEAGKVVLESVNFNLRTLVEDVFDLLAIKAYEKNIECLSIFHDDVPEAVMGDSGRVRQILINLLGNAIKFTDHGEIKMSVFCNMETSEEVDIRFEVADTGVGVPGDKIDTIFNSFSQVDFTLSRKYEGTGLGLAITKQLVEMMGGGIGVRSELGKGSVFWFNVVLKKQRASKRKSVTVLPEVRKHRILVAMDNDSSRDALIRQLEALDCGALAAESGYQALEFIANAEKAGKPFTIVMVGLDSPVMDSPAFAHMVKNDVKLSIKPHIIAIKTAGKNPLRESLEKKEFHACLKKPVRVSKLAAVLESVCFKNGNKPPENVSKVFSVSKGLAKGKSSENHILIVEDNVVNQMVTLKYIEKLGYKADIVNNGVEAVDALRLIPYDLVLMDVQMPVMDGLLATQLIRDPQSGVLNVGVPILAMTAHAMGDDMEKCLKVGMNGYICKPIDKQQLEESIKEILK